MPLREERLGRKLALAFGFMSFIPILILAWAMVYEVGLDVVLYPIVASAFVGYFFVARRMVGAVIAISRKAAELAGGRLTERLAVTEGSEIGELARAFNRITEELEQKIEQLESSRELVKRLLGRIGSALNSYEGIDTILSLVVEHTAAAMEAQLGGLLLLDGAKRQLDVKALWCRDARAVPRSHPVAMGEGVAGWVVKEGRVLRSRGGPSALGIEMAQAGEGAVLCVPLKLRERAIGVIGVFREGTATEFTQDDEALLGTIASQLAVAIENYRLNVDIERTYLETIMALALAVEAKDPYSAGHSKRVGFYATEIGKQLGVDQETLQILHHAGVLHDVGKIGIKDEILLKPTPLLGDEEKIMQQHTLIGEAIVKPVRSLQKVVGLVRHHHERYDGGGYPEGLKGEAIPLGARILAVADTYDAMITDRPYRKRLPMEEALAQLQGLAGSQLDPQIVEALVRFLAEQQQRRSHKQEVSDTF